MEMSLTEASKRLDSNLNQIGTTLNDQVLDKLHAKLGDDHFKRDVEGIRSVLQGNYDRAAGILVAETDYMKQHPETRTEQSNGLVAMATSMCAVSLLKLGHFEEAERLLRQEQLLDSKHVNTDKETKDLNINALRVALLKQGKHGEAELLAKTGSVATEVPVKPIAKNQTEEIGTKMIEKYEQAKNTIRADIAETMVKVEKNLRAGNEKIAQLEMKLRQTPEGRTRDDLRSEYDTVLNRRNIDNVVKLELQGIEDVFNRKYVDAELKLRAATNVVNQCEDFRKVYPALAQAASSLYGYTLMALMKYAEAEGQFRKEINRDLTGGNTSDSEFRQFNQLALKYALLRQGKYAEVAKATNAQIGVGSAPAPRAVVFR